MTDPGRQPIYCTGGCDVCRAYAEELGVPLIVPDPPFRAEAAAPAGLRAAAVALDEKLASLYHRRIDLEFPWESEWKALHAVLERLSDD